MKTFLNWLGNLLSHNTHTCVECREVPIPLWKRRCAFCDPGEGRVQNHVTLSEPHHGTD